MFEELYASQRDYFRSGATLPLSVRLEALKRLKQSIQHHEEAILEALAEDLGKHPFEAYATEVGYVLDSLGYMMKHLPRFASVKRVKSPWYQRGLIQEIHPVPKGNTLIIGPFNYPFQLVIEPLVGALAAGNTAIVKPSERTTRTEEMIGRVISEALRPELVQVVHGAAQEMKALLSLPLDHIFFTGSARVGRIVMEAASRNLTPVTLELGGKSPAIVHADADLETAARRIAWGKFLNAGQTCVAPDYVYAHDTIRGELEVRLKQAVESFYGEDPYESPDYGRLVASGDVERLAGLVDPDKLVFGGRALPGERYLAPTLMHDVSWDDAVMKEELFGPVLPVLDYADINVVIERIRQEATPLALYLFSRDRALADRIVREVPFGSGAMNETILQVASQTLPFGGMGTSGMGRYHGRYSFETFSHLKTLARRRAGKESRLADPPYKNRLKLIRKILK